MSLGTPGRRNRAECFHPGQRDRSDLDQLGAEVVQVCAFEHRAGDLADLLNQHRQAHGVR
ncbi:hypothetical protein UG55_10928 [Frankia sp. EI5c]|nr:hypothetical protein UG55_10928 [Frankia sp. EI5c]